MNKNNELFQKWLAQSHRNQAIQNIEKYRETSHCAQLLSILDQKKIVLSEDALFRLLAFSAGVYYRIEFDNARYKGTFWNRLSAFYMENPFLFSIAEIAESYNSVKYLLFVKTKWFTIAKNIFDKYEIPYKPYEAKGASLSLMAFSFVQAFESYDEWNKEKESRTSVAQSIQHEIQEINGVTADLFFLHLQADHAATFGILSPGSSLKLFTGEDRDSQSFIREDLQKLFRSAWEANIARIFNYKGIAWEYESKVFTLQDSTMYLPDFFFDSKSILEVKGFWDAQSRKKVTLFKKEHPEIDYYIIDADMYFSLRNKYEHTIPGWEGSGEKISLEETIPIVGMKFCASPNTLDNLCVGDTVIFKRELDNKYDKYAILATTESGAPIGHVGSDWAFIYASKMDMGMTYAATIKSKSEKVIWVRVKRINFNSEILFDFLS